MVLLLKWADPDKLKKEPVFHLRPYGSVLSGDLGLTNNKNEGTVNICCTKKRRIKGAHIFLEV